MAGHGEIYVQIEADVVNSGISTLGASGEMGTGEGDTAGNWWLHWQWGANDGFTGKGWFWNNELNKLDDIWAQNCTNPPGNNTGKAYSNDESGFNRYLEENNIQELDWLFDEWTEGKGLFAENILGEVGTWSTGGCLELLG